MKLVVERGEGAWFWSPWTAQLYARDGDRLWIGFGTGGTRSSAIRRAFSDAADRAVHPERDSRPEPVHVEEIML